MKVLVTHATRTPEAEMALADVARQVDLHWLSPGAQTADHIAGVEVLYGHLDEAALARADALRWVQHQSTGVDANLYPAFCASDIVLTSLGGAITTTVAEHAVALLLALARQLLYQRDMMAERRWAPRTVVELADEVVGIIGLGRIGRAVAARLAPFGPRLLAVDPFTDNPPPEVSACWPPARLRDLLAASRAVVVCCPSAPSTRHLLGVEQLAWMREGAYLVNISRGDAIEPGALLEALRSGRLAGAALDVTEPEPLPADSPLWAEPNLLLTPHTAGWSQNLVRRKMGWFADNLRRYLAGEPLLAVVDKQRGW